MMNRLLLRLAVVNMLTPQVGEDTPTLAGNAVFDSRLDDIEFDTGLSEIPLAIVYTEEDELVLQDRGLGSGYFERHVNLRIEICLGSFSQTVVDGRTQTSYGLPTTDSELEALLDLWEAQVFRLFWHPTRPASVAVQAMITQVDTWSSSVSRSSTDNNRLAARSINIRCRIPQDCRPQTTTTPITCTRTDVPVFDNAPYLTPMLTALNLNPANANLMAMLREVAGGGPMIYLPPYLRTAASISVMAPTDPALVAMLKTKSITNTPITVLANWDTGGFTQEPQSVQPFNGLTEEQINPDPVYHGWAAEQLIP